jgi:hypothetical protein
MTLLFFCVQNITNKEFGRIFPRKLSGIILLDAFAMSLATVLLGLLGGAKLINGSVILLAFLFGLSYTLTIVLLQFALASGPLGVFCCCFILIQLLFTGKRFDCMV